MTRRLLEIVRGVLAGVTALLLLAGVPYALGRFGGTPGADLIRAFTDQLTSDNTRTELLLRGALLLIAWACWAQLAYALVEETIAASRRRTARRIPVLPGVQALAARLVTFATLVVSSFATPTHAMAAPLTPTALVHDTAPPAPATVAFNGHKLNGVTTLAHRSVATANPSTKTYVVQDRDTFWELGDRFLGDGLRWRELRAVNVGRTMADGTRITDTTEMLQPGWELHLPDDAVLALSTTDTAVAEVSTVEVEVERGEHFWQLAKDSLTEAWGRAPSDPELAPYWADTIELNRHRLAPPGDPNVIYTGQHFTLPPIPADPVAAPAPSAPSTPAVAETPPPLPSSTTALADPDTATEPPITTPTTATTNASAPAESVRESPTPPAATPDDRPSAPGDNEFRNLALGIGGLATGAGALALTLRRLRRNQAARRQPGTIPPSPPAEALAYEKQTRHIADTEAARWIDATNRYLTHQLAQQPEPAQPAVIAMRAGQLGVELLLDEPSPPPNGFITDPSSDAAWLLDPTLDLATIEAAADGDQPYSPALLPVGTTDVGDLHLDLEQLSVVSVAGEPSIVDGWLRTIVAAALALPAAQHAEIVTIGIDHDHDLADIEQLTVPVDPDAWADHFTNHARRLHERLDRTPYQQRVQPGEIFHPTIVIIGPDHPDTARAVAEVAALVNTPIALVAATPLADGTEVHITAQAATLEPYGLAFKPTLTGRQETTHVAQLISTLADADAPGEVIGTEAAPELDPAAPEESVAELLERVTRKRAIEVEILRPCPRVRGLGKEPTPKMASIICYLAYHRDVSSQVVRETFWPASTNRSTADNFLSQLRKLLGTTTGGTDRLTIAINTGRYQLSDDIGCDWTRAEHLINHAKNRPDNEAIELLDTAIRQVGGRVASDADSNFAWLHEDHQVYGHIERVLVDAAHRLGELTLDRGDHTLARTAADVGLKVVPGHEALYRIHMRAAAAAGDAQAIHDAYRAALRAAEAIDPLADVQPETEALLRNLCPQQRRSDEAADRR